VEPICAAPFCLKHFSGILIEVIDVFTGLLYGDS
jgi:hypothetical protein